MHIFNKKLKVTHQYNMDTQHLSVGSICFMSYICANQTLFEIVHIVLQTKTTVKFNVSIVILL